MITHNKNFRTITNNDNILKTRFRRQIQSDIRRCEEVTVGEREEMVAELVNKYSIFYPDISKNLENVADKLTAIKNRLEVIVKQRIAPNSSKTVSNVDIKPTFYNTNVIDIKVSFEEVRRKIDDMENVNEAEYGEIKQKISQLEEIINSNESKRKKWANAGEILKWLADKSVDVGIALLPLFLNIK